MLMRSKRQDCKLKGDSSAGKVVWCFLFCFTLQLHGVLTTLTWLDSHTFPQACSYLQSRSQKKSQTENSSNKDSFQLGGKKDQNQLSDK